MRWDKIIPKFIPNSPWVLENFLNSPQNHLSLFQTWPIKGRTSTQKNLSHCHP